MNILLIILSVIAGLIVLILIIALFVKKSYSIERSITINRSKQEVFDYIKFLKNQDHYNKWVMMDPSMKKTFSGVDGTPGFVYAWDSPQKSVGAGEQEIKKLTGNERMEMEIRFIRPFAGVAQIFMATEATGNDQAVVKWGMASAMKYPMNIMLLFIDIPKMLGNDLAESLGKLKAILERK
jgi:hypothetical protein